MFDIKSRIARAAEKTTTPEAAKLYESLLQLNIEDKSLQKLLVEKLEETELNGADKAFFETEKRLYNVTNMGILESLNRIAASEAYKMPSVRYNVDSFRSEILMRNKPEFLLAESFLTVFKPFLYDETIQRAHTGIDATSQALVEEVSISKAVYELRNFRNNMLFDGVIAKLGQYLQYELGNASSRARLIEELGQFTFDPVVVRVVNELKGIHSKENGSFQIANAQNADSIVENIYSPILVESKGDVFYTAGNFYLIENANLTHINREEVVTMNEAFVELCEFVNSPNVTMKHNEVTIYAGENKLVFKVSEGETPKAITYNAKPVSIESLTTLFMKSAFRPEEAKMVATIRNLWENLDSFVEIEFGKKIKSKAHQGVEANIFRHNGAVYVNKVNPVMNENILYSNLGGKETQTLVLEFMNYDISESFTDLLGAEEKRAKKIERKIKEVMEGITVLEKQKTKIEVAMQDELIAESKDVKTLYNQINTELKTSKAIYNKLNHMLTENCAAPVKKKRRAKK